MNVGQTIGSAGWRLAFRTTAISFSVFLLQACEQIEAVNLPYPKSTPTSSPAPAPTPAPTASGGATILVLGSSSPAGKNIYKLFNQPKSEEQFYADKYNWVTLYDEALQADGGTDHAINLAAQNGHSTSIALNASKGSALYKNSLDYALKTYPKADAIIVNFPAIRGQEGETVASVISNLQEIERRALAAGVGKVWFATSQPYANKSDCFKVLSGACDPSGLSIYQSRIDLTKEIVKAFPGRTIDFHSPLAKGRTINGVADPALLNQMDKLHPNVEGHKVLRDTVIAAKAL